MATGAMVAATVGSAYMSSKATKSAAKTQAGAADRAARVNWDMYAQQREDQMPWIKVGKRALFDLADLYGVSHPEWSRAKQKQIWTKPGRSRRLALEKFEASPGYQFRLEEGIKARERGAAAHGMSQSGAQMKALEQYGQNIASDEFGSYANRLASMAGIGQTATAGVGAMGQRAAETAGSAYMAGGAARAGGQMQQGQIMDQGISNLMYAYQMNQQPSVQPMSAYTTTQPSGAAQPMWGGGNEMGRFPVYTGAY